MEDTNIEGDSDLKAYLKTLVPSDKHLFELVTQAQDDSG